MRLKEAYQMWKNMMSVGISEIKLGLNMISESRKK